MGRRISQLQMLYKKSQRLPSKTVVSLDFWCKCAERAAPWGSQAALWHRQPSVHSLDCCCPSTAQARGLAAYRSTLHGNRALGGLQN